MEGAVSSILLFCMTSLNWVVPQTALEHGFGRSELELGRAGEQVNNNQWAHWSSLFSDHLYLQYSMSLYRSTWTGLTEGMKCLLADHKSGSNDCTHLVRAVWCHTSKHIAVCKSLKRAMKNWNAFPVTTLESEKQERAAFVIKANVNTS